MSQVLTFRNKQFIQRNYDCTNIVFCQGTDKPKEGQWVLCDASEIESRGCKQLWIQGNHRYFGYL